MVCGFDVGAVVASLGEAVEVVEEEFDALVAVESGFMQLSWEVVNPWPS